MIRIEEDVNGQIIYDDMNPQIYRRYFRCGGCNEFIDDENDLVLIDKKITYHGDCVPDGV